MKTRPGLFKLAAMAAAVLGLAIIAQPAQAQLVTYNQGDLLLGFRKAGVGQDVVINIGQASLYRDATSDFSVNVGNLGTLLSDTFGASWADDSSLQWAVFGNPTNNGTTFNGDTSNTTYISREQTTTDTQSAAYSVNSVNRSVAAGRMQTLQSQFMLQNAATGNSNATVWDNTIQSGANVDWTDTMEGTGTSSLVFQVFQPVQVQGLSPSGIDYPGNALDLYRLLAGSSGTTNVTYEGTFRIDDTGAVTFGITPGIGVVPEPSRALLLAFGLALPLLRRRRATAPAVA
ncbi:PEP-CTERM sorting domain-containing protein [Roseimicrobium gellanilyticum]|nr:PEP-CTERM sorting domain-containing protein [Roseimicrobium gellanilyticum]